ncbi:MAG: cellulase family glycosylhydrolase [Planctomycetaceae bacterium]
MFDRRSFVVALAGVMGAAVGDLAEAAEASPEKPAMQKIRVSDDAKRFVYAGSGETFVPWGFNYVGVFRTIVEETWADDWSRLEKDFRDMRKLGANVVRIHLQFGTYMTSPDEVNQAELDRLKRMLDLASETRLYLDLTGLGCYHLDHVPAWYDTLAEADRWQAQANFWEAIAKTCAGHPAVFCYDLMNEPVLGGPPKDGEHPWLLGELEGFYFVQKISNDPAGREGVDIAEAWVAKLTAAIRKHDPKTPITVGVIPWAQIWPNAKPVFYSPEVGKHLDFVSVHFYPGRGEVEKAIAALAVYDVGKPLVVEETFPLNCSMEEIDAFVEGGKDRVDGWISHYFDSTIDEHKNGAEPHGTAPDAPFQVSVAGFLEYWRDKGQSIANTTPTE